MPGDGQNRRNHLTARTRDLRYKTFQRLYIAQLVAWLVYRGLGDEGGVGEALVIEQTAEWLGADGALPDVLVAIEL